jgi:hypothetical protein
MATSGPQTGWDPWTHHSDVGLPGTGTWADLVGYEVEAADGHLGKIDEATYELGSSYVIVDTGLWISGGKVMLPAGTIGRLDLGSRRAYVARSKDEILSAPKFDKETHRDPAYRACLAEYYGKFPY